MFQQILKTNVTKLGQLVSSGWHATTNIDHVLIRMPWNLVPYTACRSRSVAAPLERPESSLKEARPFSEIPGYKNYPLIGNLLDLQRRKDFKLDAIHILWKNLYKEFGPIVRLHFPFQPPVVGIFKPEDIEELYRITMNNPIRDALPSLKKVRDNAIDNYFQKKGGLLTEDNEEWWRVRSKVQTPMMKPKNLIRYLPNMDKVALDFMERIASFQSKLNEMPDNFLNELYKWALESVSVVALNRRLGCLDPNLAQDSMQMKLINTVNDIFKLMNKLEISSQTWRIFPTPTFKKFVKAHQLFLEIAESNIRETEKALQEKVKTEAGGELTLMESLLQQEGLTRKDVVTLIIDMIFAGIDTTSHTVAFTLYCLAKNQKAQKKLQEELDAILGDGMGTITRPQMDRLSYLKACVKESLRMFPITVGTIRRLEKDAVLRGYHIPKGTQVFSLTMVSSWDAENFERVDEYIPERWARDQPLGNIHPFASLPFSHGTRMCVGRRIAEQEIYTFLARAFHRYNVEYHHEEMGMKTCLVTVPASPLKFQFHERRR